MKFSFPSLLYYKNNLTARFLGQKHYLFFPSDLSISLVVSTNDTRSSEDVRLLNALKNMEYITGQKPILAYTKSRYVGTVKRSISLVKLNLAKSNVYHFLQELSIFLLPYLQKRFGSTSIKTLKNGNFTFFCKDFQFFYAYPNNLLSDGFRVSITSSSPCYFLLVDSLQLHKFNFIL